MKPLPCDRKGGSLVLKSFFLRRSFNVSQLPQDTKSVVVSSDCGTLSDREDNTRWGWTNYHEELSRLQHILRSIGYIIQTSNCLFLSICHDFRTSHRQAHMEYSQHHSTPTQSCVRALLNSKRFNTASIPLTVLRYWRPLYQTLLALHIRRLLQRSAHLIFFQYEIIKTSAVIGLHQRTLHASVTQIQSMTDSVLCQRLSIAH